VKEAKEQGISVADMEVEVGDLTAFIAASLDRQQDN
jgi:cyanate lyase